MGSTYLPLQDVVDVVVQVGPQLPGDPLPPLPLPGVDGRGRRPDAPGA